MYVAATGFWRGLINGIDHGIRLRANLRGSTITKCTVCGQNHP